MDVYFATLGCARNQVDSEVLSRRLQEAGLHLVDEPDRAEAIVVNTCSFIEAAAQESVDTILELARYKETGNCRRLVVIGCLPQRYGASIAQALPEVDLFLGTGALDKVIDAVTGSFSDQACWLPEPDTLAPLSGQRVPSAGHSAYLKVAEGCDRRCTYCIIPRLRGPQRSRPADELVAEARLLIDQGVRELCLVAQETTAWGRDLAVPDRFSRLLDELARIDRQVWIRWFYGHPETLTDDVLDVMARHDNLVSYVDLPVQHASDAVLRAMGRRYDRAGLLERIAAVRRTLPDACLRTTLIVGFPGETDEDVQVLADFIEQVGFDHLGVFCYSDADDLPSHKLAGHVPAAEARRRRSRLMKLQQRISGKRLARWVGRRLAVMVDQVQPDGVVLARAAFQGPEVDGLTFVHLRQGAPTPEPGQMVQVRITDSLEYDLVGEAQ